MYEAFFGLNQRPFAFAPLTKRYFPGVAIASARQNLARCIERAEGVGLLIGPAGTGKSLLCHLLAEQFRERLDVAILASGRICTRRALLQAIVFELGLPYRGVEEGDLRLSLIDRIAPRNPAGEASSDGLLLVVDEAHTLPWRLIEELRQLTNLVRGGEPRVRLILAGGPQLEELLANPKIEAFNQRIVVRAYLEGLDRAQTAEYVKHQLKLCGAEAEKIFVGDALDAIHQATDGIPRLINQVCDHALLLAYAGGVRRLERHGIEEAWSDLQQLPTPWNAAGGAPAPAESSTVIEFGELDHDLGDELPAAVPFRPATSGLEDVVPLQIGPDPDITDEFEPPAESKPEVELLFQPAANPFRETFDEEEVVIDRYTNLAADVLANRPRVRSLEGRELGALLSASITTEGPANAATLQPKSRESGIAHPHIPPAAPAVPAAPMSIPSDDDLIVIEDDPPPSGPRGKSPTRVQRREYGQLFAQLQRR